MPSVRFLGHSTVLVEVDGVRLITDPILRERVTFLRRVPPPLPAAAYADVDAAVVSHLHHDHCDPPSLAALGAGTRIVAPAGSEGFLRRHGIRDPVTLRAGGSCTIGPVTITATPAVHDGRRVPFGPAADAVGYLFTSPEAAVYFAGDTALFADMRTLFPRLDMALLPVWGWGPNLGAGHLDPEDAAEAAARLRPRRAVPVHWGTLFPYGLEPFFGDRLRSPAPAFAEAVKARGLPTEVTVLAPGEELAWRP